VLTSQINLSGFSQFWCDKSVVSVFNAMHFDFELETGSEIFVEVLVEHQVTVSHDFCAPLVQTRSCEGVHSADLKIIKEFTYLNLFLSLCTSKPNQRFCRSLRWCTSSRSQHLKTKVAICGSDTHLWRLLGWPKSKIICTHSKLLTRKVVGTLFHCFQNRHGCRQEIDVLWFSFQAAAARSLQLYF